MSRNWLVVLLAGVMAAGGGYSLKAAVAAQVQIQDPGDVEGAEVQTRGPVHEAFAGVVTFNPQPGVVCSKAPPDPIEEMPPDEKPAGENVTWIPGYWAWDDERNDYLWVSGTWRALPPGRAWVGGYWAQTAQGYQWTSGYWVDAAQQQTTYLPTPPATIEAGPNVAAPSPDYMWMPGCWMWTYDHYAWRPGYWAMGRADWDWVPPHYIWTPRGHIFVGGFWDYPLERRGCLFAPVFFGPRFFARPHFVYSPSIVIDLDVFPDHLFCRPRYSHYYFGDYYAPAYVRGGFYASFSFQLGHHGYDPIYSHSHWVHRNDRDWDHRVAVAYRNRRDHEDARPPRTWAQQRNVVVNNTRIENRIVVANTFDQYRRRSDNQVRFQPVARTEREQLVQRTREVQVTREERRNVEMRAAEPSGRATETRAITAQAPRSSIVSKPVRDLGPRNAPPEVPRAPRTDPSVQPTKREQQREQRETRREERETRREQPRSVTPSPTPAPAPVPNRNVETPDTRRAPTRPQPSRPERTQPERLQPERQVQPTAPQEAQRVPPLTPQARRESAEPRQTPQERREVIVPRQQPVAPSIPPQERRAVPQRERDVTVDPRARVTPPAVPHEPPGNGRAAEVRRNPGAPGNEGRKGAEELREHGRRDRDR